MTPKPIENASTTLFIRSQPLTNTAWRVNAPVLAIAQHFQDNFRTLGSMVVVLDAPEPVSRKLTADEISERYRIHKDREERLPKAFRTDETMETAKRLGANTFWIPHRADHRGRLYALPDYLSYQGNNLERSLLLFDEALPLGPEGAKWLAVHLATVFGTAANGRKLDKSSFQDRESWVLENESKILDAADEPRIEEFWIDADEPWQFLAGCFEWAAYRREGESYRCRLPVALDGSNNALQHFALLSRDEDTAKLVNLIPSDEPADIYAIAAQRFRVKMIERHEISDTPFAKEWSRIVDRKWMKPGVMNFGYGIGEYGTRVEVRSLLRDERLAGRNYFPDKANRDDAIELFNDVLWEVLRELLPKASEVRDWLQKIASIVSKEEAIPMFWQSPSGFPCCTDDYLFKSKCPDPRKCPSHIL